MNLGFEHREQVDREAEGRTVLAHLVQRYRHSAGGTWRARLAAGELSLDQVLATGGEVLRRGQWLVWRRPPWEEPPVPRGFAVLFLDEHLLAVGKPSGLPSLPNGGFLTHTLLHLVRRLYPDATPLHRLGRGTSGLLLFARSQAARRALAADWREGRVGKEYLALVQGRPPRPTFTVDAPIGRVAHPRLGQVHAAVPGGKAALSHVRCLGARDGRTLVAVRIATGRPHQIRIHMAAAGHPLVGDPLYVPGGQPGPDPGLPGDPGYRLHSWRLSLTHPQTGALLELECAPPPDLRLPTR